MDEGRRKKIVGVEGGTVGTAYIADHVNGGMGNVIHNDGDSYSAPNAQMVLMGPGGTAVGTFGGSTTAGPRAQPKAPREDQGTDAVSEAQPGDSTEDEERYKMDAKPRGLCYIFTNQTFKGNPDPPLVSYEKDRDDLVKMFGDLNFDVKPPFNESDAKVIEEKVKDLSEKDHGKYDCVIVVFLAHGREGTITGKDNAPLMIATITSFFTADKCPSLANKPKLFFFQTCRGDRLPEVAKVLPAGTEIHLVGTVASKYVAPQADFFLGFSSVSGTGSMVNMTAGSWYIQELVRVFHKYADTKDLESLMTMVNNGVSKKLARLDNGIQYQQTPEKVSRLRKFLYFK